MAEIEDKKGYIIADGGAEIFPPGILPEEEPGPCQVTKEIELRPYQQECIDTINSLPDGSRAIVALATGLGKTVVASRINRKGRMLILSHRDELVRQPGKYFPCSFGIEKADEHSNGEEVVSASVQTLRSDARLERYKPDDFDVIIVDEAHHAAAPSYKKVIQYFHPRLLIGLTATPKRGDGAKLNDVFDKIVFSRDLAWGIKNGYLSNIVCRSVDVKINIGNVKFSMGDFNVGDLSRAIDNDIMFETIANTYKKYLYGKGRHTVIYCLSVAGCEQTVDAVKAVMKPAERDRVAMISGNMADEERRETLKKFANNELDVLVNCMILTEGTDLPNIDALIIARPTANESLYTQIVGRGTRLSEGKTECLLFDIMPESKRKLCSATSLLGLEYKQQGKKKSAAIDFLECLEEIEEEKRRLKEEQERRAEALRKAIEEAEKEKESSRKFIEFLTEEFDFATSSYDRKMQAIPGYKAQRPAPMREIVGKFSVDNIRQMQQAAEEDGEYDFHGMYFKLGNKDSERYIIRGKAKGYDFYISKPDMLGKVDVYAELDGKKYRTQEPMDMQEALDSVYRKLRWECRDTAFMWDAHIKESWASQLATEKQEDFINDLLDDLGVKHTKEHGVFSKYTASMIIDYLLDCKNTKKQAQKINTEISKMSRMTDGQKARYAKKVMKEKEKEQENTANFNAA